MQCCHCTFNSSASGSAIKAAYVDWLNIIVLWPDITLGLCRLWWGSAYFWTSYSIKYSLTLKFKSTRGGSRWQQTTSGWEGRLWFKGATAINHFLSRPSGKRQTLFPSVMFSNCLCLAGWSLQLMLGQRRGGTVCTGDQYVSGITRDHTRQTTIHAHVHTCESPIQPYCMF